MQYPTHYKEAEKVFFVKQGLKLAGLLFYPKPFDPQRIYPAVVVVHPEGGVKEQCASLYAWHLAEEGFVALAFDAAYQGESAGEPRFLEDPSSRVSDIHAAIDYLVSRPFVNTGTIGVLGISAGGCYAATAGLTDFRIRAVAAVSLWDIGESVRRGFPPTKGDHVVWQTVRRLAAARMNRLKGAQATYCYFAPKSESELTEESPAVVRETYAYYRTSRGYYPGAETAYLLESIEKILPYDPFCHNSLSPCPLLLIAGSAADTKDYSINAYANSSKPKELFYVEGASHVALYDTPEYVEPAVKKLAKYFRQHF